MIRVFYGEKGTGKTKRLIQEANNRLDTAKGTIVFIDDDKSYTREISHQIRFIDASEYFIGTPQSFYGFICGIAASDFDLEAVYIDAFVKIVPYDLAKLDKLFNHLEKLSIRFNIDITLSINGKAQDMPEFLAPFVIQI